MATLQMEASSKVLELDGTWTDGEDLQRGLCRGQMDSDGMFAGVAEGLRADSTRRLAGWGRSE